MISVTLYNNSSDPRKVRKALTQVKAVNCELTNNCEVESPVLTLEMFSGFENVNYCYIPAFNRYYYVQPEVINGNIITVSCSVDVLMSFYSSFQNSRCIAKRSSSKYNPMLVDDCLPFAPTSTFIRRKTQSKFTPSSSGGCYILTVGGK